MKEIAKKYAKAGLSLLSVTGKSCNLPGWKPFQKKIPTENDIEKMRFGGIALICGKVSGGLFCFDADLKNATKEVMKPWKTLIESQSPGLLKRLVTEKTPSGGYHIFGKCPDSIRRNEELATEHGNTKAFFETRGEGGYFVCAPSPGYKLLLGQIELIPQITKEEQDILFNSARSFNETAKYEKKLISSNGELKPLTDYNQRVKVDEMRLMLEELGWKARTSGDGYNLTRPGKKMGISATLNKVPGKFYCFSTSTAFESQTSYSAAALYTAIHHSGNFSSAAKQLYVEGYGERKEKPKAKIIKTSNLYLEMSQIYDDGFPKGELTGWKNLDKIFTLVKGQLNVITGIPSHGKSEVMDALMINTIQSYNWNWIVYSPENHPLVLHSRKLAEKIIGKPMYGFGRMTKNELWEATQIIEGNITFIDTGDESVSLDSILNTASDLLKTLKKYSGLVIDPWNELEVCRPKDMSETDFIGQCLAKSRRFARKHNLSFWIVAHPTKMRQDKEKEKRKPNQYDISGSAHWYNKEDNGLMVWRNQDNVEIHVQKVKFKYYGGIGMVKMKYDFTTGIYSEWTEEDKMESVAEHFKQLPTGDR